MNLPELPDPLRSGEWTARDIHEAARRLAIWRRGLADAIANSQRLVAAQNDAHKSNVDKFPDETKEELC